MRQLSMDLLKISQALDNTYTLLQQHDVETEELERIEVAKDTWKQAFTYVLSSTLRA
jgi:hypothetical protein